MWFAAKDTSAAKCGQLSTGAKKLLTTSSFWTLFSQLHTYCQINVELIQNGWRKTVAEEELVRSEFLLQILDTGQAGQNVVETIYGWSKKRIDAILEQLRIYSKDRSFSIRTDLAHERTATLLRLYNRRILYVSYMLYVIGGLSAQSKAHKAQRLTNYYQKYMQQKKNINRFFSCFFVCFSISRLSMQSKTHKAQRLIIMRNIGYQK